jgi:hypothetical protein
VQRVDGMAGTAYVSPPYPGTIENFCRPPFGRAASSWSPPIDGRPCNKGWNGLHLRQQ